MERRSLARLGSLACLVPLLLVGCVAIDSGPEHFEAFRFVSGFFGLDKLRRVADSHREGLKVIGAGFSRTGTKSMEAALIRLGHKVYDTRSMMELGHAAAWEDAAEEYATSGNTTKISGLVDLIEAQGHTATLDFPMNLFAPAFAKVRPAAKVVMTVRPTEESWVEAWGKVQEILGIFVCRPWVWLLDLKFTQTILWSLRKFEYPYPSYPEHMRRPLPWYEEITYYPGFAPPARRQAWLDLHRTLQRELQEQLPKDRFTTFDVRSGWAPLLNFLDIKDEELAAEPFPQVNDRDSLLMVRRVMDVLAIGLPFWLLLIVVLLWLTLRSLARCCFGKKKAKQS